MRGWSGWVLAACALLATDAGAAQASSRLAGRLPGKTDTGHSIALHADVRCPPSEVFRLWATAEGAKSLYAPSARIDARVGGRYAVAFFPKDDPQGRRYGTDGARVLAREPSRFLAFEWVTFSADAAKGDAAPPSAAPALHRPKVLPTWVELTLTPRPDGTEVALRHFGFEEGDLWRRSQAWFTRAWGGVLEELTARCKAGSR